MRTARNDDVATLLLELELYGLGFDYLQRYHQLVSEVTIERVQQVVRTYLNPDIYTLIVAEPSQE